MGKGVQQLASTAPETHSQQVSLSMHQGFGIIRAAREYPTLHKALLEMVQNALDENAKQIWITINRKSRFLTVRDDGDGANEEKFNLSLRMIGVTQKDPKKLGRYGIGIVSPLEKCEKFTFTSTPVDDPRGYNEWEFVREDIEKQEHSITIPKKRITNLVFGVKQGRRGETAVPWRTEIRVTNYTKDRIISEVTAKSLADGILDKYNITMKRLGTVVYIRIKDQGKPDEDMEVRATEFRGKKLDEVTIEDENGGKTTFRIFLASKVKGRFSSKLLVGESDNDFRINIRDLAPSISELLDPKIITALKSGVFVGEITNDKIDLNEDRVSFKPNDNLLNFCLSIDKWYATVGQQYVEGVREQKDTERYQGLGTHLAYAIRSLINIMPDIKEIIHSFTKGSVGKGHTPPEEKDIASTSTGTSVVRPPTEETEEEGEEDGGKDTPPRKRKRKASDEGHPDHIPITITGPQGKSRTSVKDDSLGLQISYEIFPAQDDLWILDTENGVLRINIRHPEWIRCYEQGDEVTENFQLTLAIQALLSVTIPDHWKETINVAFRDFTRLLSLGLTEQAKAKAAQKQNAKKTSKTGSKDDPSTTDIEPSNTSAVTGSPEGSQGSHGNGDTKRRTLRSKKEAALAS